MTKRIVTFGMRFLGGHDTVSALVVDDVRFLTRANDIVSTLDHLTIHFTYPLHQPAHFTYTHRDGTGWTRKELFRAIRRGYRSIYRAPERYGVWGHAIEDLVVEEVEIEHDQVTLHIGS